MDQKQSTNEGTLGRMPQWAPLANPYVPFQQANPPKYEARRGLIRGTLYPGLDLPFRGMANTQELPETPTAQLQALAFAVNELALYLDTHPDDEEALALYRQYQKLLHDGSMTYTAQQGPMNHTMPADQKGYSWLSDPWPWEYTANKEG